MKHAFVRLFQILHITLFSILCFFLDNPNDFGDAPAGEHCRHHY